MGPIMGVTGGGVNNLDLVRRSLGNLGVTIGIAILSSALYFLISPINEAGSELLSRTTTFLDVMVFFEGSRFWRARGREKQRDSGVAIATAPMPPCTAGYGLAHLDATYFFGALYLFLINIMLIATSTTLVVRIYVSPLHSRWMRPKSRSTNAFTPLLAWCCPPRSSCTTPSAAW